MDIAGFQKMLEQEWIAISFAPFFHVSTFVLAVLVIWWVVGLLKSSVISRKDATIASKDAAIITQEKHIAFIEAKLAASGEQLEDGRQLLSELKAELGKMNVKEADREVRQHSQTATEIATEVSVNLENLASTLASAPRHPNTNVSEGRLLRVSRKRYPFSRE